LFPVVEHCELKIFPVCPFFLYHEKLSFFSRDFTGLPPILSDSSLDGDLNDMNIEEKFWMENILHELANTA